MVWKAWSVRWRREGGVVCACWVCAWPCAGAWIDAWDIAGACPPAREGGGGVPCWVRYDRRSGLGRSKPRALRATLNSW
jgi:hypothetical protein